VKPGADAVTGLEKKLGGPPDENVVLSTGALGKRVWSDVRTKVSSLTGKVNLLIEDLVSFYS